MKKPCTPVVKKSSTPSSPAKKSATPRDSAAARLRAKLLAYRGMTSEYPPLMGALDTPRKERLVDWMLVQPAEPLRDLAEVLLHLSAWGQEAVLLASMLRHTAAEKERTGNG